MHRWGQGIGHVTYVAGSCFCCVRHCQLYRPPTQIFEVFIEYQYNVLALNFFRLFPVFSVMLLVLALKIGGGRLDMATSGV